MQFHFRAKLVLSIDAPLACMFCLRSALDRIRITEL